MSRWRNGLLGAIAVVAVSTIALAGCGTSHSAAGKKAPYNIVLLDGTNGNAWRAQMEKEMSAYVDQLKSQGVVAKYTAYSANNDATAQSQQMSQVVNAGGVSAILVDPVSATALSPVVEKAVQQGILVMGIDSGISDAKSINVTTDQYEWARIQADFLAKSLNGKGNIVIFDGITGYPASDIRTKAYKDVLANYSGIKVLKEVDHNWDEGKAKQLMTTMISAYPVIDGVLNQECSPGIMSAFTEAKKPLPKVICSDESMTYLRNWNAFNEANPTKKLNAIIVGNPPGIGVTGLKVAVQLLKGKHFKDGVLSADSAGNMNTLSIKPTLVITNDNLKQWVDTTKDQPDTYTFSNNLSDDDVTAFMQ